MPDDEDEDDDDKEDDDDDDRIIMGLEIKGKPIIWLWV